MASFDDRVEIALPSDENYVCGLLVTAASIAKYANKEATLVFNILDGGIKDDTFADFEKRILKLNPKCEFRRLKIDESVFAGFPAWSGNRMTYARLMLSNLLPDVDHVIYCDTDFLWTADIVELWKQRDDSIVIQSARDGSEGTESKEALWYSEHNLHFDSEKYFCAGLSFYNLKLFRDESIVQKVSDFLVKNPDVKFADQTAMNVLLGDRARLVERKWQAFSWNLQEKEVKAGCAIHFAGEIPWKVGIWTNLLTDTKMIWHRFNAEIHGESVWKALRRYFTPKQIILRRGLFLLLTRVWGFSGLFRFFLLLVRRGQYWEVTKPWLRRCS